MDIGLISSDDRPRHRMLVEAGALADQCGFTSFNIGEYNGWPSTASSPAVILAAVAERTRRIRLGAAVALPNVDALRLAEDYATLDALSGGRVELVVGGGNSLGQEIDSLGSFEENLELLLQPINGESLQPPPIQTGRAPVWVGVDGSSKTAVLPGRLGLKLMLTSASDASSGLREVVDSYLDSYVPGAPDDAAHIGGCWHVNVAAMGSPAEIVDRLCALAELLRLDTQLLKLDMGGMREEEGLAMIELFGTDVLPLLPRST